MFERAKPVSDFDEAAIKRRLEALPRHAKTAFAAGCAELLWPLFERYARASEFGADQADDMREVLDSVWRSAAGSATADIRANQAIAEALVPQDQPWIVESGYGESSVAAIAYAARTWLADSAQEATWGARQVYEAADYAAQLNLSSGSFTPEVEQQLMHSTLVRWATEATNALLDAAEHFDISVVQERARQAARMSPEFP